MPASSYINGMCWNGRVRVFHSRHQLYRFASEDSLYIRCLWLSTRDSAPSPSTQHPRNPLNHNRYFFASLSCCFQASLQTFLERYSEFERGFVERIVDTDLGTLRVITPKQGVERRSVPRAVVATLLLGSFGIIWSDKLPQVVRSSVLAVSP